MAKPQDLYDPTNNVAPTTNAGNDYMSVRSDPNDFGAQEGAAVEKAGQQASALGNQVIEQQTQFAKMATESKVNDDYANKYTPAAADLRAQYDSLDGQDKIHGYQGYISSLQDLNRSYTENAKSPYEKQLMSGLIDRHITGEIDGAKRELVQSQKIFAATSTAAKIAADSGYAAANYNNPDVTDQVTRTNNAALTMTAVDAGANLNNPADKAALEETQRQAAGQMTIKMLNSAIKAGDVQGAFNIRAQWAHTMDGDQQLHYDNILHAQSMQQAGIYSSKALSAGDPLPEVVGAPPAQVQAVVANTAQSAGHDVNDALTVARIESSYGQNTGKIGNIGQNTSLPAGATLEEQAQKLITDKKAANEAATQALGRTASNAEGYVVYQQGLGGGAALLKAADTGSEERAIDILAPLYPNRQAALTAIINNGGNATMSADDFVNFLTKKYNDNAKRAAIEVPQGGTQIAQADTGTQTDDLGSIQIPEKPASDTSIGDAIMKPHTTNGPAVQPAVSPRQQLLNFDDKYPDMIARANAIPNVETRERVIKSLETMRSQVAGSSNAYTQKLVNTAETMMAKPNFTMDMVPPETYASLAVDHPQTIIAMQARADHIAEHGTGASSKDAHEYGENFFSVQQRMNLPPEDPNRISDETQLYSMVNNGLTMKGFDAAKKALGQDDMRKKFLQMGMKQITKTSTAAMDTDGDRKAYEWYNTTNKYIDDQLGKGAKLGDLLDPNNKDYAGNSINVYRQGIGNMVLDRQKPEASQKMVTMDEITEAAKTYGKTPEQVRKDAIAKGYKISE